MIKEYENFIEPLKNKKSISKKNKLKLKKISKANLQLNDFNDYPEINNKFTETKKDAEFLYIIIPTKNYIIPILLGIVAVVLLITLVILLLKRKKKERFRKESVLRKAQKRDTISAVNKELAKKSLDSTFTKSHPTKKVGIDITDEKRSFYIKEKEKDFTEKEPKDFTGIVREFKTNETEDETETIEKISDFNLKESLDSSIKDLREFYTQHDEKIMKYANILNTHNATIQTLKNNIENYKGELDELNERLEKNEKKLNFTALQ